MKNDILYKELSYQVIGALFDAFKTLGSSYHEKYCQKTVAKFLRERQISFIKEYPVNISINGELIVRHFLDFLIDSKIVLEIKKGNFISMSDIKQVQMYLKTTDLRLGILAYFASGGIQYKRILNSHSSCKD